MGSESDAQEVSPPLSRPRPGCDRHRAAKAPQPVPRCGHVKCRLTILLTRAATSCTRAVFSSAPHICPAPCTVPPHMWALQHGLAACARVLVRRSMPPQITALRLETAWRGLACCRDDAAVTGTASFGPGKQLLVHVQSPVDVDVQHATLDSMRISAEGERCQHRFQVKETAAGLGAQCDECRHMC